MRRWNRQLLIVLVGLLGISSPVEAALGDPKMSSSNYSVVESETGAANGDFTSGSTNYKNVPGVDDSGSTLGDTAVGNSSSTSYQTNAGFNTTAQPGLTLCLGVTGSSCADFAGSAVSLGNLSVVSASTALAKFGVKNYTSYGYVVTIATSSGTAPSNNGRVLASMGTQSLNSTACSPSCDPATPGTAEQFGINLAANTTPASYGAGAVQNPSGSFSYGTVASGYSTADKYRFFSGDTIASAGKSSGETDYTISFMANITPITPGGQYTANLQIIATGTY